jgi:hypothetical protein
LIIDDFVFSNICQDEQEKKNMKNFGETWIKKHFSLPTALWQEIVELMAMN